VLLAGEAIDELFANLREGITGVLELIQQQGRTLEKNVQLVELAV
jgi:predicted RNase H-like HicB family nuclease